MDRDSLSNLFEINNKTIFLLTAILVLAAGLRFWNVGFDSDLKRYFSGDARNKFYNTKYLVTTGEIPEEVVERSKLYRQPMFLIKSYGWIWKAVDIIGFDTSDIRMRKGFTTYMILFSLGTVVLVYFLGYLVTGRQTQGLYAALLFAALPVNVLGSLYVKEDIPLMFWFTATFVALSALVKTGSQRIYFISGILIGLAVSTKYPGLLLFPLFLLAHLFVVLNLPRNDRVKGLMNWRFFVSLALVGLVFLMINFHVVTEWADFVQGFQSQVVYASAGHHDGTVIRGADYWWTFYLRYAILPGITFLATTFFLTGMALAIVKKNKPAILISVAVVFIYFYFESSPAKPFPFFARYLQMIYPLMAVLATLAFFELWAHLRRRPLTKIIGIIVGLLLMLVPLATSVIVAAGVNPDTRITASQWIDQNIPSGTRIFTGSSTYCPHHLNNKRVHVKYDNEVYFKSSKELSANDFQFLIVCSFDYDRYRYSLKSSAVSQKAYKAYQDFDRELQLIKVFKPRFSFQTYGSHNPIIMVYKIPEE
jgi:hypothetical protein